MKAFKMSDGDVFPDTLVEDREALRVNLQARLSIIRGEYMSDVFLGVPLGATKDETDLYIQKIVLNTSGVQGIQSFTSSIENKVYKCRFTVNTVFGDVVYE